MSEIPPAALMMEWEAKPHRSSSLYLPERQDMGSSDEVFH